ncbi:MAG: homoserine dehydrogenase [Candidatus Omnitrophica bacterium]|nr:Homoserine dehydrogenase [bacterium]NUN97898.1 homoserine dehydrogenase [Candidatus Omnitrophota bacterium]
MSSVVHVGLVGFGVVGTGLVQCLKRNRRQIEARAGIPIRIKTIADLDITTPRNADTTGIRMVTDAREILEDPEIDIVVELVGGTGFAHDLISRSLRAGKDVVTANKALLALRGHELFDLAAEKKRLLLFEAAVGGGIPIIQAMRTGVCSTEIERIYGILNGTANYILTRMEESNLDFERALIEAKAKGYAEADPTYDIEGHDTTHKLVLLSQLAYDCKIRFEEVHREGITRLTAFDLSTARELGYRIKLLAIAKKEGDRLEVRCHPVLIPLQSQLAAVSGVYNAVLIVGNPLGPVMFFGQGAGGDATGAAVAADLMEAARQIQRGPDRKNFYTFDHQEIRVKSIDDSVCAHYLRLVVEDRPGVIASVATALAEQSISIASIIQKERHESHQGVPVVITTHESPHSAMARALEKIGEMEFMADLPYSIRIEDFE